jgi:hypothetical protein
MNHVTKIGHLHKCALQEIAITTLDVIHRLAFYLKPGFPEAKFCLRLQVEAIQAGPIKKEITSVLRPT